jgi:hypothetical protein
VRLVLAGSVEFGPPGRASASLGAIVMTAGHPYQHRGRLPVSSVAAPTHEPGGPTKGRNEVTDATDEADVQPA